MASQTSRKSKTQGRAMLSPEQQDEAEIYETRRAMVPALEELLYEPLPVLDHGYVRVIDYMGDDGAIVNAARVSYGRGTKATRTDAGLINYLMRNQHTSPFEMCEIKLHVKLPIFVARQWVRHRTASLNEYSARYSVLDTEFYLPPVDQLSVQSTGNQQGRGRARAGDQLELVMNSPTRPTSRSPERGDVLSREEAELVLVGLRSDAEAAFRRYHQLLNEDEEQNRIIQHKKGISRELARINLPLSTYTQWYWKTNLHNLFHFLWLRADEHAQWEIREYAKVILGVVEAWVPLAYQAFVNYRVGGAHLSAEGLAVAKRLIAGEAVDPATLDMSPREWRELRATLGIE